MLKSLPRAVGVNGKLIKPWASDPIYKVAGGRTALSPVAQHVLLQWLSYALAAPGAVAEFGVWRGGSAALIASKTRLEAPERRIHLFDTFEGIPSHTSKDNYYRAGDWKDTSLGDVSAFLAEYGAVFHPGDISVTVNTLSGPLAFVHVDCDMYEPVKAVTEHVYPILSKGGVIVYDDYGWMDCAGAKLAVDEYYAGWPDKPIYLGGTSQAVVVKR